MKALEQEEFAREWSGLLLVADLGVAPKVLAADPARGILVLEDLGTTTAADALLGSDPALCSRALLDLARTLAGLHAATSERSHELQRVRDSLQLGPAPPDETPERLRSAVATLVRIAETEDVGGTRAAVSETERLATALRDPGWLAFSSGDTCPDNVLIRADGVRLVDLESSGFRHALLDLTHVRSGFPTCWCTGRLPAALSSKVDFAYFEHGGQAMTAGVPSLGAVEGAWLAIAAARLLGGALRRDAVVSVLPQDVLTARQVGVARLEQVSEPEALAELCIPLARLLRRRWKLDSMDVYPAFRP